VTVVITVRLYILHGLTKRNVKKRSKNDKNVKRPKNVTRI